MPPSRRPSSEPPRVFISYAHESEGHQKQVLHLAQRLRQEGVDAQLDGFVNGTPSEGWPLWMERQIAWADTVLVVCSPTYLRRFEGRERPGGGLGVAWEAVLTRQELYDDAGQTDKFVPVLLDDTSPQHVIPKSLRAYTYLSPTK